MSQRRHRWMLPAIVCGAVLFALSGCQTLQLNGGILRDGTLRGQHISLDVRGKSVRIPIFQRGSEYHLAPLNGQRFGVYLQNHTSVPLQVELVSHHPTAKGYAVQKHSFVLAPKGRRELRELAKMGRTVRYVRFPSWGAMKTPDMGQFRVTYRGLGKKIYVGKVQVKYAQCQTYQQSNICPASCICASYYKREKVIVKLDRASNL